MNRLPLSPAATEESIETILDLAHLKDTGKCKVLVASGCMAQRYSKELESELPEVDLFVGTGQYHLITDILDRHHQGQEIGDPLPKRSYVDQPAFIHTEKDTRVLTGPIHSAYLKISEGCNRRCAFCIIPKLRGNTRSRTVESLVEEASSLVKQGARELNLVGQDLTEYGMEWKYRERLETLLPELCKIDGVDWIRLHYVYPDRFSDELVQIVRDQPKIVKYLDMPIQHTSNSVLKAMNRRLTKEKLFDLISKLRTAVPGIVFRTSIIVGFPGETEEDFDQLCRDLKVLNLDHVGVFKYSQEEGTPAASMADQVHPSTKRRRSKTLIALLQELSIENKKKFIGNRYPVLVEGPSEESEHLLQGRLPTQAQDIDGHVLINDLGALEGLLPLPRAGDMLEVEITEAMPHDLVGRAIRIL